MPVSNESHLWPKILICKVCKTPVEEGTYANEKMTSFYYICPKCKDRRTKQYVEWVDDARAAS